MASGLYEDDDEYIELLTEYERYIKSSPGAYEDFDEWLEIEYGRNKAKVHSPSRKAKRMKDQR